MNEVARYGDHRKRLKAHNRVWELRRRSGLSREELTEILRISPRTVYYFEKLHSHMPSLKLAWRIGRVFGVSLEEVFSPEPFGPSPELDPP